jgi:predicted DNA-binding WGR domain protein/DNA polymerase III delta prime subunit
MNTSYQQYLQTEAPKQSLSTDEVIGFLLPLFEEVLSFHEANQVAPFEKSEAVFITNGRLDIDEQFAHVPSSALAKVQALLEHQTIHGYEVKEKLTVDEDVSWDRTTIINREVQANANVELTHPVYLPGYTCYEMRVGHHDARTDIFCLGLILGSAVMGLDLYDIEDLNQFAVYRSQPKALNERIHPTVAALVTEMTELDRSLRSPDLQEIIHRLKFYRDFDPQRQIDLTRMAAFEVKKPADRKSFILSKLRNRLFDTTRRNRLLYYKPNTRFVNLTVSSVPMVLHFQSINPSLLFTWNEEMSKLIVGQKDILLNKYLRFEDHPYLNTQLNGIRQSSESDKREYGFSQLKLVVAFLHWHNLKDDINERIQSPLLLLPVELERKKSLKEEHFVLKIVDNAAIVNPVLANFLKDLYGITLPETIDFDDCSMQQFYEMVQSKIDGARQGVKLNYIDKPRLRLVHHIAKQTVNNYKKKLGRRNTAAHHIDYSYSEENYKPLGLELFRQKVEPRQSSLEFLMEGRKKPGSENFAAEATVTQETFEITDSESNPYSWDFDVCNIVLGNFNYKKMSLVGDYNTVAEEGISHSVFDELFSPEPRKGSVAAAQNDASEWYHVITADPTQTKAVLQARTGKSYLIQGPPGTGKSQTITNLIADFLAQGKTILFVCEKRAALDVVYHRLQQNKLAELCCYIHDSQSDKKEFIRDLRGIYEDFLKNKMDVDGIRLQRKIVLERLLQQIEVLNDYQSKLKSQRPEARVSTRTLMERMAALKEHMPVGNALKDVPNYKEWVQFGDTIKQLSAALEESGAEPELASHFFSKIAPGVLLSENPVTMVDNLVRNINPLLNEIGKVVTQQEIPSTQASTLTQIKNLVEDSVLLLPLAESGNLQVVDPSNKEARVFEEEYNNYKKLEQAYKSAVEANKRWTNKFEPAEVEQSLPIALKNEGSFLSFLNGDWRRLKAQLKQSYDFAAHNVRPKFSQVLQQLQDEYQKKSAVEQGRADLEKKYRLANIETTYLGIEVIRRKKGDNEVDFLLQHQRSNELVIQLSKLRNGLQQLEAQLKQLLYEHQGKTLLQIRNEIATISGNADTLKDLLPAMRKFITVSDDTQKFLRNTPLSPMRAEAAMAGKTLKDFLDENPSFTVMNSRSLQSCVGEIEKSYAELLKLNSEYIRAQQREKFVKNYELSNASVVNMSAQQRIDKKIYFDGRRILEHEMGKTMRYKSIRELASNDSGRVLKDIKPVWLMSPLSVSDSLPLDTNFFDVVIFDEASQITLEEGIPALFRAPQAIIVGDDKQMPPSNFFNTKAEDPEDLEMFEGESEEEILSADADSLLVQGARKLDSTMLSWHYRSRYETLISYSNHAFYAADLLTIPDRVQPKWSSALMMVKSPDEGLDKAELLLQGSMSFHYMPESVYALRGNIGEAKYIANMVKRLLTDDVDETIGIVAFSQEQQGVIEEEIEALGAKDKAFEELLEKAYARKDEGQFTGLFVKNLENVQGDERDIIIMSVCYGHDAQGKMLMNFGPINRKGGEKRLNVIFSRAKKHMAVVSSIRYEHITNDHNEGANYFKRFLHYAEMVSTGNMTMARTILDGLVLSDRKKEVVVPQFSAVSAQLKKALESRALVVDTQIGQSSFKCSLAVKKAVTDDSYSLAILIDEDDHYNNDDLVEQFYQRPAILRAFGWRVVNVYAKDWLEDQNRVVEQVVRAMEDVVVEPVVEEDVVSPLSSASSGVAHRLVSADGARFWEIRCEGVQLNIRTGKVGTKGQVEVRIFETEEEAEEVMKGLVEERRGMGFEEKFI